MRTLTGILWELAASLERPDCCCETSFYFEADSGEVIQVSGCADIPQRTHIQIDLDGSKILRWTRLPDVLSDKARAWEPEGKIALVRVIPVGSEPSESLIEMVKKEAKRIEWFWRYTSRGYYRPTVDHFFYETDENPRPFNSAGIPQWLDAGPIYYDHISIWGGTNPGFCGHAPLGGRVSWNYLGSSGCPGTRKHELGHSLDKHHNGTPGQEYGDRSGVLGNSAARQGIVVPQLIYSGWLEPEHVRQVEENAQLFIGAGEWSPHEVRPGECLAAEIRKRVNGAWHHFVLSTRNPHAVYSVPRVLEGSLYIHTTNHPFQIGHKTTLLKILKPGESWQDESGIVIHYRGFLAGTCKVDVHYEGTFNVPDQPFPAAVERHGPELVGPGFAGLYRDPRFPMQGVQIQVLEHGENRDDIVVNWFTHDEQKNQQWMSCQGRIEDGVGRLKGYRPSGGTFENPNQATKALVGEIELCAYGPSGGLLHFDLPTVFGRGHLELSRLSTPAYDPLGLEGQWVIEGQDNAGFSGSVNQAHDADGSPYKKLVLYWYTHMRAAELATKVYRHRWFEMQGRLKEDGVADLQVFWPDGARGNHPLDEGELRPFGSATFDGHSGQLIYHLTGQAQKQVQLRKFA